MRIVILDANAVNPGDLDWSALEAIAECGIHPRTSPDQVLQRCRDAEIVLTNKTVIDKTSIESLPKLRYIGVLATGYNVVDLEAARARGIPVTNIPAYSTMSVAQTVFSLLLEITHGAGLHDAWVRRGGWTNHPDFCYWAFPLLELDGLTMGVLGYGNIGRQVGGIANAFGMNLIVHTRTPQPSEFPLLHYVNQEEIFRQSDVLTLHAPLTETTKEIVNSRTLGLMKPSAVVINTGRGGLVNERDLADALNAGKIRAAGVDVLSSEPPQAANPLLTAKNCVITPHLGWGTVAARKRLMKTAVENIRAFMDGSPQNVVNRGVSA